MKAPSLIREGTIYIFAVFLFSGCAYTQYMKEEQARQRDLTRELKAQRSVARRLEVESAPLEVARSEWEERVLSEERQLKNLQVRLGQLEARRPRQSQPRENGDIKRIEREIEVRKARIEKQTEWIENHGY